MTASDREDVIDATDGFCVFSSGASDLDELSSNFFQLGSVGGQLGSLRTEALMVVLQRLVGRDVLETKSVMVGEGNEFLNLGGSTDQTSVDASKIASLPA